MARQAAIRTNRLARADQAFDQRTISWEETARRLGEVTSDPKASAADIGRVIDKDPVFAEKVIQTAASSGYAASAPVASVTRAVILLGTRRLRNLAEAQRLWRESA